MCRIMSGRHGRPSVPKCICMSCSTQCSLGVSRSISDSSAFTSVSVLSSSSSLMTLICFSVAGCLFNIRNLSCDRILPSPLHLLVDLCYVCYIFIQQCNVSIDVTFRVIIIIFFISLVWAVAISYILLLNTWPLQDLKNSMFPDHNSHMLEGYLTSVILAWVNARCVSFCLDR